jgi:hypothetical protein
MLDCNTRPQHYKLLQYCNPAPCVFQVGDGSGVSDKAMASMLLRAGWDVTLLAFPASPGTPRLHQPKAGLEAATAPLPPHP